MDCAGTYDAEYAEIILDTATRQLDRPFTYHIPEELRGMVRVGSAVVVPFSNSRKIGYVLNFCDKPQLEKIKDIYRVISEPPFFGQEMAQLCHWIAERYMVPLSQAFRLVMPPGRSQSLLENIKLKESDEERLRKITARSPLAKEIIELLKEHGGVMPLHILKVNLRGRNLSGALKRMEEARLIERELMISRPAVSILLFREVELEEAGRKRLKGLVGEDERKKNGVTPLQMKALKTLEENGGKLPQAELMRVSGIGRSSLLSLESKGLVRIVDTEKFRDPFAGRFFSRPEHVKLNREQEKALRAVVQAMEDDSHGVFLLHGITGSGKTEVYLRAISHALEKEKSAIVLVPEISLTPQMVERFKGALGEQVAVLHSRLSAGERYDQWRRIRDGEYRVVIGARSALFAPVKRLGLIVIDEEHEATYKENSSPRYHARDVAIYRAKLNRAVVVLGSATPQLETLWRARRGEYCYLVLPRRIDNRPLPRIEVVDMRELNVPGMRTIFSPKLVNALINVYESGEQAILFLNRRGFAHFLQCHKCGYIFRCENCSVSLCFHLKEDYLLCHHCNRSIRPPFFCPDCGNREHRFLGVGTERVEEELRRLLPPLKCLRMDADTTQKKHAHWDILDKFRAKEANVLLGTQMIAKGLDIPNVTLVGVINADTSMALPDFRAAERTFQLLTQVSGRAGRGHLPGRVIIQTYSPESNAVEACSKGDEETFYAKELKFREEAGYPPFLHIVNLIISSVLEGAAKRASQFLGELLRSIHNSVGVSVLGPAPAPLSKLKGRYRYHLLVKSKDLREARENIQMVLPDFERMRALICKEEELRKEQLTLAIDVDPISML